MERKTLDASISKTEGDGVKVEATITTESIDRDGEVLVSQGMDASEFEKNPVVFYNHDYAQPIGKISDLRRGKGKVDATIEFAKRPADFDGPYFPEFVESLVEQGIVKGISVGFVPMPGGVRRANKKDEDDYGGDVRQVYSKWKLLEVSVAPLPANATALVSAVRKGFVDRASAKHWLGFDEPARVTITVPRLGSLSTH